MSLHRSIHRCRLLRGLLVGLAVLAVSCGVGARGDDLDDRFIDLLLERGLVQTAENAALQRLADEVLKPADRVSWTIRLSRAYMRHSQLAGDADRQPLADRAVQLLEDLAAKQPPGPRREAIATQRVLLLADRAEQRRWDFEASGGSERLRGEAVTALSQAADRLRELLSRFSEMAKAAGRRTSAQLAEGELSVAEVRDLERSAELRLARLLVDLGETAPLGAGRESALQEADQQLQSLASGWIGDARTWQARLLRARLLRVRGDVAQAAGLIRSALNDRPAPWLVDEFTAELVRGQLAAGQVDVALGTLLERGRERGQLSDELSLLQIEALLVARRVAEGKQDQQAADELWARAQAWVEQLRGGARLQAQQQLDREKEAAQYGPQLAAVLQSARAAYHAGEIEQALALFATASQQATATSLPLAADEFDYIRGSILLDRQRYAESEAVLGALLVRSPHGNFSQDASLLRAYALGRQAAAVNADPALQQRYADALAEHRQRFANTPSAIEATWLLAVLEESRQQWTRALELYQSIASDPTRGAESRLRSAILYERLLDQLRENRQSLDDWEDRAAETLAAYVRAYSTSPGEWTASQAEVAVRLVRIVLAHREHPYAQADRLLQPVLLAVEAQRRAAERDGHPLPAEWERLARVASQLRVVSLAGQGRLEEARQLFQGLAVTDPDVLLELLGGLSRLAGQIPPPQRQALGQLQIDTAKELRKQRLQLTAEQKQQLDAALAEAYQETGNLLDAVTVYESLLRAKPRDRQALRSVAELLDQAEDPASLIRAKGYWQRLEALLEKGSPEWLEVRYRIARCASRLGQVDEALKLIRLTRLVYPQLGGPELTAKFADLEAWTAFTPGAKSDD